MSYSLEFLPKALKEWDSLNSTIKEQFKKKLQKVLENPKIPNNKLSNLDNVYKIKLRSSGFRLAYQVKDEEIVVLVVKVGKRDTIYKDLMNRFD